ncbi:MAG: riboflavin synthase [Myxococcales bacterium]|nr:riboflavin synthase [Myxococcales bacterium]MCB9582328.1 riboflavin synthase [Polyangiaceae bacterium]
MFTGLVETTGKLRGRDRRGPGYRLTIETDLAPLEMGESIAVNGACLTVVDIRDGAFGADVSEETVEKTTLGRVGVGGALNLERSLRLGDRLGGHLVSGHVDGVARVTEVTPVGEAWRVAIAPPAELMRYLAPKGSVTLDGVSLTINATGASDIELMLIPHTREVTNFSALRPGSELNLEVDLLARYVVHYLERGGSAAGGEDSLVDALSRAGFLSKD